MSNQVADTLRAAKAKIDSSDKWTKHRFATDRLGREVGELDPSACRFCSLGAVNAVTPGGANSFEAKACLRATRPVGAFGKGVASANDAPTMTHKRLMAWWDDAILYAEEHYCGY